MVFLNKNKFKNLLGVSLALLVLTFSAQDVFASNLSQLDLIRNQMACYQNINPTEYKKLELKLQKLISQNNLDYSNQSRFEDVKRLIQEQKYTIAVFELNDLIKNDFNKSQCYELLADICLKTQKPASKTAYYFKQALSEDNENVSATYKLARLYLKENKNILGTQYLQKTVELTQNPNYLNEIVNLIQNKITPRDNFESNNLYEVLGHAYLKLNNKDEAYKAYIKALQLNPNDLYLKYYLANNFYYDNLNKDAVTLYNIILKENNDSQIRTSKAKALVQMGNLQAANEEYNIILNEFPNSKQAKYGIYKIYENKLPLEKIIAKVNNLDSNYTITKKDCLEFSNFLAQMEDLEGSDKFKRLAQQIEIKEQQELFNKQKQEFEKKKMAQEKLRQQQLKEEQLKLAQLRKQQEKEELRKKQKEEQRLLELKKQENLKKQQEFKRQQELKKQQELLKKQEELKRQQEIKKQQEQKALQEKLQKQKEQKILQEKQSEEQKQKAYLKQILDNEEKTASSKNPADYQKNKLIIDKYQKTTPKDYLTYLAIANTYKQMLMPYHALENYKQAQKLNPTNSDIYYNLGLTYLELNSLISSKENLTKAINLNSLDKKAYNLLAFVDQKIITQTINSAFGDFEKKNYIKALDTLDKGLAQYSSNSQLYYYRALVYDAMNRNAAQIFDLQKAIELDPSNYMAYYQLGCAYEKIKDERAALVAWERFLSIEPDEPELISKIQKKVVALGAKYY